MIPISDFDYELPQELIAQRPLDDRSASRLLHIERATGGIVHRQFRDSLALLQAGDLLVLNDTRVTARRLTGRRSTGGSVEALVLRREGDSHVALARPAKRLRPGTRMEFGEGLGATVTEQIGEGLVRIEFDRTEEADTALQAAGEVPLPPYVHEKLEDTERYQTVYAATPGSAAAPTAGLHFTPRPARRHSRQARADDDRDSGRRARHFPSGRSRHGGGPPDAR